MTDDTGPAFRIHRLVREFVMKHVGDESVATLNLASTAIQCSLLQALRHLKLSIHNPPKWCSHETHILLPRSVSVLG